MPTEIVMRFGEESVSATLNDTETAQAFAENLPASIRVRGASIDFCGRMPWKLPYEQSQVGHGWINGDVNYNPGGGWFAVLFGDEENSRRYGDQVNIGQVSESLDVFQRLGGAYDVEIELA